MFRFQRLIYIYYYNRWKPPRCILEKSEKDHDIIRQKYHIYVDGEDIPPPIKDFKVSIGLMLLSKTSISFRYYLHNLYLSIQEHEIPTIHIGFFEIKRDQKTNADSTSRSSSSVRHCFVKVMYKWYVHSERELIIMLFLVQ